MTHKRTIEGGCHCGRVHYKAEVTMPLKVIDCNCSICQMTGFQHIIVSDAAFELISGADTLVTYQFNTGQAKHLFCGHCGIKSFYKPRSHPDGWSLNARCAVLPDDMPIERSHFDGQNWEANIDSLD